MKKIGLLLLIVSLIIVGCAEQLSNEELKTELEQLSNEELDAVIKDAETDKPLAGQAYARKISSRIYSVPTERLITVAKEVKAEQEQGLTKLSECVPASDGLVNWWDGDDISGTAVNDLKNNNDGTLMNGVTQAVGKVNHAFSFDGVDDEINIPLSAVYNQYTIDFWMKVSNEMSGYRNGVISQTGNPSWYFTTGIGTKNTFIFDNGIIKKAFRVDMPAFPDQWVHWAITLDLSAEEAKLYFNGEEVYTDIHTLESDGSEDLFPIVRIGNQVDPPSAQYPIDPFKGLIDEISLYNKILIPAEIQTIYHSGSGGKYKPVVKRVAP